MKLVISACLWFWGTLFSLLGSLATLCHWDRTAIGLSGVAVITFGFLVWFHFKEYKHAEKQAPQA